MAALVAFPPEMCPQNRPLLAVCLLVAPDLSESGKHACLHPKKPLDPKPYGYILLLEEQGIWVLQVRLDQASKGQDVPMPNRGGGVEGISHLCTFLFSVGY